MRKQLVLRAVAALPAAFLAPPADASFVRYCEATGRATFSPALTTTLRSGTMTWTYNATCVGADTGGPSGVTNSSGTHVYDYTGSCVTATMVGPGGDTGVLVGGTEMVTTFTSAGRTFTRYWTFVPDSLNPCNMTGAAVVQHGPDVFP